MSEPSVPRPHGRPQVDQQVFVDAVARYGRVPSADPDMNTEEEPEFLDVSIPIMRRSEVTPGSRVTG